MNNSTSRPWIPDRSHDQMETNYIQTQILNSFFCQIIPLTSMNKQESVNGVYVTGDLADKCQ